MWNHNLKSQSAALEEDEDRTYSCCCYGHIHIDGALFARKAKRKKTNYHDARIINGAGQVLTNNSYHVPLNHYDNSLSFLVEEKEFFFNNKTQKVGLVRYHQLDLI